MKTTMRTRPLPISLDGAPRRLARRTVVMVASPGSEPTRADVAFNLAAVCAEVGQQVVVVRTFVEDKPEPVRNGPLDEGDTSFTDPEDVRDLLSDSAVPRVSLLNLQDLVATQAVIRFPEILETLRHLVDVVILDVPSFLTVHHGQSMLPLADVVLVVAERRFTTFDQLRQTNVMLKRLDAPVVGMALTKAIAHDGWLDEDEAISPSATESPAFELGSEAPDGLAAGSAGEDAGAVTGGHRRRRPVVDHASLALGARSDQPADMNAPTPEA
jgi:hypothetical protein